MATLFRDEVEARGIKIHHQLQGSRKPDEELPTPASVIEKYADCVQRNGNTIKGDKVAVYGKDVSLVPDLDFSKKAG